MPTPPLLRRRLLLRRRQRLDDLRSPQPHVNLAQDQHGTEPDEHGADRPLDEGENIAAGEEHGAPKIFLEARAQDEAEQDRRRVKAEHQQEIAEHADRERLGHREEIVLSAVDADADEEQRARIEIAVGDGEELHPDPDHRHVQHDEHNVADPETRDQAPENIRMLADQLRPRHDALDDERAQKKRHYRIAGNAEAHGRNEIALHGGMGGGLRTGDAGDGAVAESLRVAGDLLLGGVSDERGDRGPRARD